MSNSSIASLIPRSMYQSDFHSWPLESRKVISTKTGPKPIERTKYRPPQMDLEILQPFKADVSVPFNLLHRKKRVIQINPHAPIPGAKLEIKLFELKLKARHERPGVYMVPQICLDDVPEDIMYGEKRVGGLVSSIYTSDWKKACEFMVKNSPLSTAGSNDRQVTFVKKDLVDKTVERIRTSGADNVLPLEIGLSKFVSDWEKLNPKEFVDTTELFWEKHPKTGLCAVCNPKPEAKGLSAEEKAELESCLEEDALRTPYTLHPPGYTGYVPNLPLGIKFRKNKFNKYDTFVTTTMEAQGTCIPYKKQNLP